MSPIDIVLLVLMLVVVAVVTLLTIAYVRRLDREYSDSAPAEFHAEVRKLRAEIRELKRRQPASQSVFMDMADVLNRLDNPPVHYDEASLEVPLMDLALGKVVKVRLLSGKEVSFRLPAKTKSGTKFRFRRGGDEGRDLHLTVLATPVETP